MVKKYEEKLETICRRRSFDSMKGIIYKPKITHLFWILVITVTFISCWKYFFDQNIIIPSDSLSESKNDNRIPSIVHFVVGQGDRKEIQH